MVARQARNSKKIEKKFYLYKEIDDKLRDICELCGLDNSEILSSALVFFLDAPPGVKEGIIRHYSERRVEMLLKSAALSKGGDAKSPPDEDDRSILKAFSNDQQLFERVREVLTKDSISKGLPKENED